MDVHELFSRLLRLPHPPMNDVPRMSGDGGGSFGEPVARRWFWRGHIGFSHVRSLVGGQMQPGGC